MEYPEDKTKRKVDELWYKYVPEARVGDVIKKSEFDKLKKEIWELAFDMLKQEIKWFMIPHDSDDYVEGEIDYVKTFLNDQIF